MPQPEGRPPGLRAGGPSSFHRNFTGDRLPETALLRIVKVGTDLVGGDAGLVGSMSVAKLGWMLALVAAASFASPAEAGFFQDFVASLQSGGSYYPDQVPQSRIPPARFKRQTVSFPTKEKPGTIIIDPHAALPLLRAPRQQGDPLRRRRRPPGFRLERRRQGRRQAELAGVDAAAGDGQAREAARTHPAGADEGRTGKSARRPRALSLPGRQRYRLPDPRDVGAMDDRPQRLVGLYPPASTTT